MENKYLFRSLLRENKRRGITYSEFAKAVGIHNTTVSTILNGTVKPTDAQRKRIAEYFNVRPEDIIFPRDNSVTVREVAKQKDSEIKSLKEKCKRLEDELDEFRKLIEEYKLVADKVIRHLNKLGGK